MTIIFKANLNFNPDLLGLEINQNAGRFNVLCFSEFLERQQKNLVEPIKPNKPIYNGSNTVKRAVFEQVYIALLKQYNKDLIYYKKQKNEQELLKKYPPNLSGYAQYITENKAFITPFLSRWHTIPVSESHRKLHTYITGGTGSGKSEAIKSFIWHYLTRNQSTAIILLTPHGKIAEEVAKFSVNLEYDRLVYIHPDLHPEKFPCLNPFDIPNKDNLSDREAENYAESFRQIFQELLQGVFSEQMNALLKNILPIIIKYPNSSVYDLLAILEEEKAEKYLNFAKKNFKNKNMLDFLNGQFLTDTSYQRTKQAMQTRLQSIFSSTLMQALMVGKSTVNLESLINQKKLIVFNISKGTAPNEWEIIGKFIIATIKILSFRREKQDIRYITPCHLFIDECQNYITDSMQEILEESRKYKLYLTLAQQTAGAKMSKDLFRSIMGNTGIKLTGRNGDIETLTIMAKSTGANVEELKQNLATGRFSLWRTALTGEEQKPPIIVTMPKNTLDNTQAMTQEQWQTLKNHQIQAFYRSQGINTPKTPKEATKTQNNSILNIDLSDYLN